MFDGQFAPGQRVQFGGGDILPPVSGRGPASLIDRTTGTNIGNMTNNGGLAAVFDGVTSQSGPNSAQNFSGGSGYAGKTVAAPTAVDFVNVYGGSNQGYVAGANPSVTINLRGKNGAAPSGPTDGDLLGTTGSFTDTNTTNMKVIDSADKNTVYDHVFVEISQATNDAPCLAELEIYGWQ